MRNWKTMLTKDANILLKSMVIEGAAAGPRFVLPEWDGFKNHLWIFKNDEVGIHYLYSELEKFSRVVRDTALSDSAFALRYRTESKKLIDDGVSGVSNLFKQVSPHIPNNELNQLFVGFCNNFKKLTSTIVMTLEELDQEAGSGFKNSQDLITAVTPAELSIEAQEELERIILITEIQRQLPNIFSNSVEEIKTILKKYPALEEKLNQHVRSYEWIPLNFAKPLWDVDFFISLMRTYVEEHQDLTVRKNELEQYSSKQIAMREKIFSNVDSKTQILCAVLEATSYIRFYRNAMFSYIFYKAFPILRVVAGRTGIPFESLPYFTPNEITVALLSSKQLSTAVRQSRKEIFVVRILDGMYEQFDGAEGERVANEECPPQDLAGIQSVTGRCAYPGVVRGTVRIIRDAREIERIEPGCIMVCKETNPDIVLAMSRAGAIVTDEGGVTSHAAIVSREMKKPCVIGTRIGTKVLKDGDLVEVDAEKGIVRKIVSK